MRANMTAGRGKRWCGARGLALCGALSRVACADDATEATGASATTGMPTEATGASAPTSTTGDPGDPTTGGTDTTAVAGECGDGVLDGDEGCDDGNLRPGDACSGRARCRASSVPTRPPAPPASWSPTTTWSFLASRNLCGPSGVETKKAYQFWAPRPGSCCRWTRLAADLEGVDIVGGGARAVADGDSLTAQYRGCAVDATVQVW